MESPRRHAFAFRVLSATIVALGATGTSRAQATDPRSRASVDSNGGEADFDCRHAALSADGRQVAFVSISSHLVAGDHNHNQDVFVHDRRTGATVRVSVDSNGVEGNSQSDFPVLSADGRFVAFESDSNNLVASDGNGVFDVFVHDRDPDGNGVFDEGNGVTERVSVRTNGVEGDNASFSASISADGTLVAFASEADNLAPSGDHNGATDIFVHDRTTGRTARVSVDSANTEANSNSSAPSISGDGRFVAFASDATNLVANDNNGCDDVFVRDRTAHTTVRASVDSAGVEGDRDSGSPQLGSDGSRVVFTSLARNFSTLDDSRYVDVFVHDFAAVTTELASADSSGAGGTGDSSNAGISADGRIVVFTSAAANLTANDQDGRIDVFVRDLSAGTTALASQTCWLESVGGDGGRAAVSSDGSALAFSSLAAELVPGDTNGVADVFVYDRSIPEPIASSSGYGAGFAGTLGIPDLAVSDVPRFGSALTVTIGNSNGNWTPAVAAVGSRPASIPTRAGGTLLVDAPLYFVEAIPPLGLAAPFAIPLDPALCGMQLDLQVLELDAGAPFGISFTPGLEWVVGH